MIKVVFSAKRVNKYQTCAYKLVLHHAHRHLVEENSQNDKSHWETQFFLFAYTQNKTIDQQTYKLIGVDIDKVKDTSRCLSIILNDAPNVVQHLIKAQTTPAAAQSQKAVSAHFTSKQILPFGFAVLVWRSGDIIRHFRRQLLSLHSLKPVRVK